LRHAHPYARRHGGGGAGQSGTFNQFLGSGAIGNIISNPVPQTNGITYSTSNAYFNQSGGGGSHWDGNDGSFMMLGGSGVIGVRITSKG
jgi:hypothetical protein